MQLDIFEHSRDVMLRNDVVQALEQHDAGAARAACERLAQECPLDESLPALLILTGAIEVGHRKAFRDHDALRQARHALQENIRPAALRTFGDKDAAAWLGRLWQDLARRAELLTFNAECADEHAASLWLHAATGRPLQGP